MKARGEHHISLPPPDARLIEPGERIPTPLDDLGLIDVEQLIADVKSFIDPSYELAPGLSVHHFYWHGKWYDLAEEADPDTRYRFFRDIPPHKGLLPREFENFLHLITEPAPVPHAEVVTARTESWEVASNLFKSIKRYVHQEKQARRRQRYVAENPDVLKDEFDGEDIIGEEVMQEILEKHFRGIARHLERLSQVPDEHRYVDHEAPVYDISKQLGRLIVPRARVLVRAAA